LRAYVRLDAVKRGTAWCLVILLLVPIGTSSWPSSGCTAHGAAAVPMCAMHGGMQGRARATCCPCTVSAPSATAFLPAFIAVYFSPVATTHLALLPQRTAAARAECSNLLPGFHPSIDHPPSLPLTA